MGGLFSGVPPYYRNYHLQFYLYFCSSVTLTGATGLTPSVFGGIRISVLAFFSLIPIVKPIVMI